MEGRIRPHVLGIGGGSSVGKTTLARRLLADSAATPVIIDEIAMCLSDRRLEFPSFPRRASGFGQTLFEWLLTKHEILEPHLRSAIERAIRAKAPTMVEGEGLGPGLAADYAAASVRCGFVVEENSWRLSATLRSRSERFRMLPEDRQTTVVEMNVLYNRWIAEESGRHGVPAVASQPWTTLPRRFVAITHALCTDPSDGIEPEIAQRSTSSTSRRPHARDRF